MTPAVWSLTEDIVPVLGFAVALVAALALPVRPRGAVSRGAKWFFVGSVVCYLAGTVASVVQRVTVVPGSFVAATDAVELMWVPFVLFGVYSMYARQQLNDALAAQATVEQTAAMLERIVDTTPAGIVVLDAAGRITFANDAARRSLELVEDEVIGSVRTPGWVLHASHAAASSSNDDLRELVFAEQTEGVSFIVEWPEGRRRRFMANSAPVSAADGSLAGAIVAFVESEPWLARGQRAGRAADHAPA